MLNSTALEVGIGLVFVFLVVSLLCTAINELISSVTRARATQLREAIRVMLDGTAAGTKPGEKLKTETDWTDLFFNHQLINGLSPRDGQPPSYIPAQTFAQALLSLVNKHVDEKSAKRLGGLNTFGEIRSTLEKIPNATVREALVSLLNDAESDLTDGVSAIKKFQDQVEVWFEHSMDRVSGWYKRRTQWFLVIIAVLTAGLLNVDAVAITRALSVDRTLRESVVRAAEQAVKQPPAQLAAAQRSGGSTGAGAGGAGAGSTGEPGKAGAATSGTSTDGAVTHSGGAGTGGPATGGASGADGGAATTQPLSVADAVRQVQSSVSEVVSTGVPIGWVSWEQAHRGDAAAWQAEAAKEKPKECELEKLRQKISAAHMRSDCLEDLMRSGGAGDWMSKIFGLLATAAAASLGAPFWFDVLNKFMSVRAAGKAPEEDPRKPKEVLKPQSPKQTP
ncbi:MAG TPA: hypothetical protein VF669_16135 [Tepidisphaeraceae bacterium]|jgi:hypothetical protein